MYVSILNEFNSWVLQLGFEMAKKTPPKRVKSFRD